MNQDDLILVRQAITEDLPYMVQVEQSAFPKERWASDKSLLTRLELFPSGSFVALKNQSILGFSNGFPIGDRSNQESLDPTDSVLYEPDGEHWLLRNVAVLREAQGKGIGTLLVQRQLQAAREHKAKSIRFTATPNLDGFYSKLGFKKTREPEEFHGVRQAFWEKELFGAFRVVA